MAKINKVELKKQLGSLGISVEGNYVRKVEIEKALAMHNEQERGDLYGYLPKNLKDFFKKRDIVQTAIKVSYTDWESKVDPDDRGLYVLLPFKSIAPTVGIGKGELEDLNLHFYICNNGINFVIPLKKFEKVERRKKK